MEQHLEKVLKRLDKIEQLLEQLTLYPDRKNEAGKTLSMKQSADYLHLSISRIYSLIYEGRLQTIQRQKNSKILFSIDELNNYLNEGSKL